jgi:intein/homing endonuclease
MVKLINKKLFDYNGKVHDLTVENSHSYNVNSIGVHNSAAGSLLAYVLSITQIDPIKNGLLFERFLTAYKKCLHPDTWVKTNNGNKQLKNISIGDMVLTHSQQYKKIIYKDKTFHYETIDFELEDGTILTSSINHKWIVLRNNKEIEILANDVRETDKFIKIL